MATTPQPCMAPDAASRGGSSRAPWGDGAAVDIDRAGSKGVVEELADAKTREKCIRSVERDGMVVLAGRTLNLARKQDALVWATLIQVTSGDVSTPPPTPGTT